MCRENGVWHFGETWVCETCLMRHALPAALGRRREQRVQGERGRFERRRPLDESAIVRIETPEQQLLVSGDSAKPLGLGRECDRTHLLGVALLGPCDLPSSNRCPLPRYSPPTPSNPPFHIDEENNAAVVHAHGESPTTRRGLDAVRERSRRGGVFSTVGSTVRGGATLDAAELGCAETR